MLQLHAGGFQGTQTDSGLQDTHAVAPRYARSHACNVLEGCLKRAGRHSLATSKSGRHKSRGSGSIELLGVGASAPLFPSLSPSSKSSKIGLTAIRGCEDSCFRIWLDLESKCVCTYCRRRSRRYARHAQPRSPGRANRTQSGIGCMSCACSPGSSRWGACTWGTAWCAPGSSSDSRSLRCFSRSICPLSRSPPVWHRLTLHSPLMSTVHIAAKTCTSCSGAMGTRSQCQQRCGPPGNVNKETTDSPA